MSRHPIRFKTKPKIIACASAVGGLEAKGPLKPYFDLISDDSRFGMDTWEKAESEMLRSCTECGIKKANLGYDDIDLAFSGDLINQCTASTFGLMDKQIPHIGLYGACSTFVLGMSLAALSIESGLANTALAAACSHFCSAERQYRYPLEYGCQRTPTAQTTVTGAGCAILSRMGVNKIFVDEFLPGIIRDLGICDANNMGAAMAPACCDTLVRYFSSSGTSPSDFDLIATGDLGYEGHRIFSELCDNAGYDVSKNSIDCGMMIYDCDKQEVSAGGSGCGCSATVFSSIIFHRLQNATYRDVLLIGTGALLNPSTILQKESIPGIAHLVRIRRES